MNKKGFTLVEVMVVVIILGILATIGVPQFADSIEKAKGAEARAGLSFIQIVEKIYYAESDNNTYVSFPPDPTVTTLSRPGELDITLSQEYWYFSVTTTPQAYTATAIRRSGIHSGQTITMDNRGSLNGTWEFI